MIEDLEITAEDATIMAECYNTKLADAREEKIINFLRAIYLEIRESAGKGCYNTVVQLVANEQVVECILIKLKQLNFTVRIDDKLLFVGWGE